MIDVEKVLLSLDVTLVAQRGDEVQGLCPMHKARTGSEDHNPSWWINTVTGVHFCFSCGYKGNVYTLVSDVKGIDYFDAKDFVEQDSEIAVDVLLKRIRELPQYIPMQPVDDIGMSEARLAVYTDAPDIELKKRFLTRDSVNDYGVLWDKENEAWILPIRDSESFKLLGWQEKGARGRFFRNQPVGVKKSKTLFGINAVKENEPWVVVESPLDAVRLSALGYNGVATFGAILSEDQAKIMRRASVIYAAFDNDEAGKKACEQMLGFARKYGIELKYFDYTGIDVKDIGDMLPREVVNGLYNSKDRVWGKAAYGA
jgi:DNA primase